MVKHLSYSMVSMLMRCGQQFERRYIRGEIIPPGVAARRGGAVAMAAEINHRQKLLSQTDLPVGDLQDAARDSFVTLVKEKGVFIPKDQLSEKQKLLSAGLDTAVRLTKLYREKLAPAIVPDLVEERLTIDVGLAYPLVVVIDVTTKDGWLLDMKTAGKSKGQQEADNSLQLTFYAGAYADLKGSWPSRLSLEVLVNTKDPKRQSLETTRGQADWQNLLMRLQFVIAQIQAGLFPPCDPGAWVCSPTWCGYYPTCKYAVRRS